MLAKLHLGINPIIVKELRSRMRDTRAFITLTAMLVILGSSSYLLYRLALTTSTYTSAPLSPQIGQSLFIALAFLELMIICAIVPAVTAGTISSEQEKQTYDMLMATPLHPASILWGKLVSALSYVFLLIFAAIPMASLIFIFGGVTLRDMLKALIVLVVVAVTLGIIGLFLSTWLGRTSRATVLSYLIVVALIGGPLIAYIATGILNQAEPPRWILVPNPLSALFSALTPSSNMGGSFSSNLLWTLGIGLGGNMGILSGSTISLVGIPRPLYHYSLPLYGAIALVLYLLSTRLVRPTQRWKFTRREIVLALALLLLFGGTVGLAFLSSADRYENAGIAQTEVLPAPEIRPPVIVTQTIVEDVLETPETVPPTIPAYPAGGYSDTGGNFEFSDTAAIYVAVVRELYTVDHTYNIDDPPNFPVIYLVITTDDGSGDPNAPQAEPALIPEEVQTGVSKLLSGSAAMDAGNWLPAEIIWIGDAADAPYTPTNTVAEGGAVIKLGNIFPQPDGSVLVSASLYLGELAATGKTYVLNLVEASWRVTGYTGVQWMR
ncbi:MAG: ABC transporter permease [Anaerolineales bacterium]|jgi:ABC-2 type transport system permease protein